MTSFNKILTSIIQLLAITPGRQKVCRFFQYFCRYLSFRYQALYDINIHQRNQISAALKKADSLSGAMAMTRKVLRFGPSINAVKTIIVNINEIIRNENKQSTHIVIIKTFSAFFLSMFFILDHYIWLFRVGVATNENRKAFCEYYSSLGWLLDCFAGLIKNIAMYLEMNEKERKAQTFALSVDTARLIFDVPVAYSFVKPGSVNGKIVGVLGSITSLIGIYQLWK